MKKFAIIDLGSNSIRMSTYTLDENKNITETGNYRSMIKLSEGMSIDGLLSSEAQLRAVNAILQYKSILTRDNITEVKAVATAAVRKAKNGNDFVDSVKEITGIIIEVIDGEREAYYDFLAVTHAHSCKNGIICDIGGGSTELIGIKGGELIGAVSLPVASRNITEKFFAGKDCYIDAYKYIMSYIRSAEWLSELKNMPIYGIGGCLRAVAKYDLKDNTKAKIKAHSISAMHLTELFDKILAADYEQRAAMEGIGEERPDIIGGGVLVAKCLAEIILPTEVIVSDVGVRDGILCEMQKNLS